MTNSSELTNKILSEKAEPGLEKFLNEFYNDRVEDLRTINSLMDQGKLTEIGKIAHQWKGYSAPYGFQHLGFLGSELENSCSETNSDTARNLINEVSVYLDLKNKHLNLEK